MLESITKVAQIEILDGTIQVLFHLIVQNNGAELSRANHRTNIPYDVDPRAQIDFVNNHLQAMGYSPLDQADITRILLIFDTAKQVSPNAPVSG